MSEYKERPDWWPPNPYPESVFTMTTAEYVEAIPDDKLRTAISGYMARYGWEVADHDIYAQVEEQAIVPLEEAHKRIRALEVVVECVIHSFYFNNMPYPQAGDNRLWKAITVLPEEYYLELRGRAGAWIEEQEETKSDE